MDCHKYRVCIIDTRSLLPSFFSLSMLLNKLSRKHLWSVVEWLIFVTFVDWIDHTSLLGTFGKFVKIFWMSIKLRKNPKILWLNNSSNKFSKFLISTQIIQLKVNQKTMTKNTKMMKNWPFWVFMNRFGEDKTIVVTMPDDVALANRKIVNTFSLNQWILLLLYIDIDIDIDIKLQFKMFVHFKQKSDFLICLFTLTCLVVWCVSFKEFHFETKFLK